MSYRINEKACIKCGACEGSCPVGAISLKNNNYVIDPKKCIACGLCASVCPVGAPEKK